MYECFHCGERKVVWDADYSFEDFGLEGEGVVNSCHCSNCGADILYMVPCYKVDDSNSSSSVER